MYRRLNCKQRRLALVIVAAGLAFVVAFSVQGSWATAAEARAIPDIVIVQQRQALARVVTPADASKSTRDAAAFLVEYIQRSTSVRLEVVKEPAADDVKVAIHCGATTYVKGLNLGMATMDPDGFVIVAPDEHHIVILGASDTGQSYAVYEFLERYLSVRWLFPGSVGEYVPVRDTLAVPAAEVREQPLIGQRLLSGLGSKEQFLWATRNRMGGRVEFHHNLWKLFPPEKYFPEHPEFFPLLKGRRSEPQPNDVFWQPCFTAEGSVAEAVKNIDDFFEKNSWATSYSLGINDGGGHCECSACMAKDGSRTNALGLRDASPSYYAWCNAVAEGVSRKYPDKKLGLLAYSGVYSPAPGLRLDGHLVPFLTYDRMKWIDPEIERKGHALTEEWEKSAPVLGWYDYIYGGRYYTAPRVYFHKMAEYLRYGYEHNVRHYYAEAYPAADWHEGPKLFVLLKLLWNPYRDVDAILEDWYRAAVGPEAAPYLAEYFSVWEGFWTKRVPGTAWFSKNGDRQYLDFNSNAYLEVLKPEDIVRCEALLTKVVAAAGDEMERARARYFYDGFMARKVDLQKGVSSGMTNMR